MRCLSFNSVGYLVAELQKRKMSPTICIICLCTVSFSYEHLMKELPHEERHECVEFAPLLAPCTNIMAGVTPIKYKQSKTLENNRANKTRWLDLKNK